METKLDLTKSYSELEGLPADGNVQEQTPAPSVEEPKVEPKKEETKVAAPVEPSVEENKVPYSRFKKYHDAAKSAQEKADEAEAEAAKWKERAERLESERFETKTNQNEPDPEWLQLYGDNEQSRNAYKIEQRRQERLAERLKEEAIAAVRNERLSESKREKENLSLIDENLESLTDTLGRELTEKEQEEVLDIVDEFTPKGEDGNYAGAMIPFNKAWEIREMRTKSVSAPAKRERNAVAALTSSRTDGEPASGQEERDRAWKPGWDNYKSAL